MTDLEDGLGAERGRELVALARAAIVEELGGSVARGQEGEEPKHPESLALDWLEKPGASFVTLEIRGMLRGCIGSLAAKRPLGEDVAANARAAAFKDPRFPPLKRAELDGLSVEVSVLSEPQDIECSGEQDLCRSLRPGIDGVALEFGSHRATYLPQVWDDLPEPAAFLAALKKKARLAPDFWSDEMRFSRYTVEKFGG